MTRLLAASIALAILDATPIRGEDRATPEFTRAAEDYARSCQGCHRADGSGVVGAVPPLAGFVGYFTHLREGRAFLIRVPGVAMSALDDERLAAVLNWTLWTFSREQLPADFVPYTALEVGTERRRPLESVSRERSVLIARLRQAGVME